MAPFHTTNLDVNKKTKLAERTLRSVNMRHLLCAIITIDPSGNWTESLLDQTSCRKKAPQKLDY